MNFSTGAHRSRSTNKENVPPPKADASRIQRPRVRTVLGVLSENEDFSQSQSSTQGSQFSKGSSVFDSSQVASSGLDKVILSASGGEMASDSFGQDAALLDKDMEVLQEISSSLWQDSSLPCPLDNSLSSSEVLCVYADDIHQHMRARELRFRSRPYLGQHPDLTAGMRLVLVDWLAAVFQEYMLLSETLFLAVNYLDRFLSRTVRMKPGKLQLVGATALLVAAKLEEVSPPGLDELVYVAGGAYTREQLVKMERIVLNVLDFNMASPTIDYFLRVYMAVHPLCLNTTKLALYVAELSLLEIDPFQRYAPSVTAAAAYCLANYTFNRSLWPRSLHAFTGYAVADIHPCLTDLHELHVSAGSRPQQVIREKYKTAENCYVSFRTPLAALPFLHDSRLHPSSDASASA